MVVSKFYHSITNSIVVFHLKSLSVSFFSLSVSLSLSLLCCRMDSAIIKEEIKAFLGNRRISQAVVAQVTG